MTAGHAPHNPDQPSSADPCAACKTAAAVLTGVYAELPVIPGRSEQQRLPWCETCAIYIAPVMVAAGYVITLAPIPAHQLVCSWGEYCGRLAVAGYRYCASHLRDLERTYRDGDDNAARPPALEPWCILCKTRHAGECQPTEHEHQSFDGGSECLTCLLDEDVQGVRR